MNVFLPYADIIRSVRVLDDKRLGKQRVECYQILRTLTGRAKGWRNHPATKMWRGYENALRFYMNECISEWKRRGFRNTMRLARVRRPLVMPPWFGNRRLHVGYQSNLVRKDAAHYRQFFPRVRDDLSYVWPV